MSAATTDAPPARMKERYLQEVRPALMARFGYSSVMQAPRLEKVTLNMGVGEAKQDSKVLKAAREQLATISGQQPSVRRARKSIAAFKLREGNPVGVSVTLRAERAYEFLDRLVSIAIPRIRDFRGLNPRSFDGRGNYSMGVREQIIFPEIDYDAIDEVRGLDITITTSARTDAEAFALLLAFGMPFATQGRPRGFDADGPEQQEPAAERPEVAEEAAAEEAMAEEVSAEEVSAEEAPPEMAEPGAGGEEEQPPARAQDAGADAAEGDASEQDGDAAAAQAAQGTAASEQQDADEDTEEGSTA
jgi:large subunit ribosomal protein L5